MKFELGQQCIISWANPLTSTSSSSFPVTKTCVNPKSRSQKVKCVLLRSSRVSSIDTCREKSINAMQSGRFTVFAVLVFAIIQASSINALNDHSVISFSPFSSALETLQKQIGYSFKSVGLLRRAMTHASYSEENNRALSVLGVHVIETSVSLRYLGKDIDISSKELNRHISEISKVESSCVADGMRLGLQKVVRVSPKTNSSTPAVVCGALRAVFGAIAVDAGKSDDAGSVFWKVHGDEFGGAVTL